MKKLSLVISLALILSALFGSGVLAQDITIFDTMTGPGNTWWNNQQENQEVEPGCEIGRTWDVEGFAIKNNKLYMIGSYNFVSGVPTGSTSNSDPAGLDHKWTSGDIFVAAGQTPLYGATSPTLVTSGVGYKNNFNYNYVFDMDWSTNNYVLRQIDSEDTILKVYYSQNAGSNPFMYLSGSINDLPPGNFMVTKMTGAAIGTQFGVTATDGFTETINGSSVGDLHYVVEIGLNGLPYGETWFHFTQECGNDNLMGKGNVVPLPGAVLLLGAGLARLAAYARRREDA